MNRANNSFKRRTFIALSGLTTLGLTAYSFQRGIRIPPFAWEPRHSATQLSNQSADIQLSELIPTATPVTNNANFSFRAYSPEPALRITAKGSSTLKISVNNVSKEARLLINNGHAGKVTETREGISRILEIALQSTDKLELEWKLPLVDNYRFASIGDTGGQAELGWCIERAHALGAKFLLHLGDFNYYPGDYENSIKLFNQAPLPCYVSIGNHDSHDSRPVYKKFLADIGPLNHHFTIGQTRFVNLDTAANTLPYSAGQRGDLLRSVAQTSDHVQHTLAFTHRPLHDPQNDSDHDLGSEGERDWLIQAFKKAGIRQLLSGHIHIYHRQDFAGIDNIIVGQGLGHQDLLVNDNNFSKIAIGEVDKQGSVDFQFPSLKMPMALHCHPRTNAVKQSLATSEYAELIDTINRQCLNSGS